MLTLGIATGLLNFVGPGTINATLVAKEKQPVVSCCHKEVLDDVIGAQAGALHAFAASVLLAIVVALGALDVTATSDGDDHFFFRNQVKRGYSAVDATKNFGASVVAVFCHHCGQLIAHN